MSSNQMFSIQTNELVKRLYNIDDDLEEKEEEIEKVIEIYTKQLKNSDWKRKEAREMIVSGYVWMEKKSRKERKRRRRKVQEHKELITNKDEKEIHRERKLL